MDKICGRLSIIYYYWVIKIKRHQLLVHPITWMSFEIIMLSDWGRQKTIHIIWVHFKILENVNKSKVTGSWSVFGFGWDGRLGRDYGGAQKEKTFF